LSTSWRDAFSFGDAGRDRFEIGYDHFVAAGIVGLNVLEALPYGIFTPQAPLSASGVRSARFSPPSMTTTAENHWAAST
jgi:hypothetical protein